MPFSHINVGKTELFKTVDFAVTGALGLAGYGGGVGKVQACFHSRLR
jgi:hypothetical protein